MQIMEGVTFPDDLSLTKTLLVAVTAYMREGLKIGFEQAWSALPAFEQERIREAARYFPFLGIPEDKEDEDDPEEDEDEGI